MEPAPAEGADVLVGRCYTRARRHPLVIGRWPGGGVLWGGPYSVPQLVVMAGSFVALLLFRPVWAHFGFVLNVLLAFGVPYALGLTVRRLNVDGRNPLVAVGSVLGLLAAPSTGRLGGRPVKGLDRRRGVRGVCTVTWQEPHARMLSATGRVAVGGGAPVFVGGLGAGESGRPARAVPSGAASTAEATQPRVLSGVGALIAARAVSGIENEKG